MWLNKKLETVYPNTENRVHWKAMIKPKVAVYCFLFWLSMPANFFSFEYYRELVMESKYLKNIACTIKITTGDLVESTSINSRYK